MIKKGILARAYMLYFFFVLLAVAILAQVVRIQIVEGDHWRQVARDQTLAYVNIDAVRGSIFAENGSLLATDLPYYEIRMDANADALTDDIFYGAIDSLSLCLSKLFKDKPARDYRAELVRARKNGERFHLIKSKVDYTELKQLRTFPLFRRGRYKGGFLYIQKNMRARPFQLLAARTIGYERENVKPVGLEGAYTEHLGGISGKRLMQKIAGGVWMPVFDENELEPQDGQDLITTIDINIQDVAEHALLKQLQKQDADHGCVVLMEVATGEIKAIANLSRTSSGNYYESYNYAIGESTEPGSTFKLASVMVALEDGLIKVSDTIDTRDGTVRFYDRIMRDSHEGGYGKISLKRAMEVSSNVAISRIIDRLYSTNPAAFINGIKNFHLDEPLGLEIAGEGKPQIKNPGEKNWSGTTLPWMSIGYESRLTPMQILAFYNAVANNGRLVKPMFVKELRSRGKTVKEFSPVVINEKICSQSTIDQVREMLEGVVENGTASNLKNTNYKIAGKTGTAQIANDRYGYSGGAGTSYQASFVGYFPAEKPAYTCIVVVNAPSRNVYYGNLVAGPIFREIADKVYATSLEIHDFSSPDEQYAEAPTAKWGDAYDIATIYKTINIPFSIPGSPGFIKIKKSENELEAKAVEVAGNTMPDLRGMGVRDAVFLLENKGLRVSFTGKGKVVRQSVSPGRALTKGLIVELQLS